MTECDSNPAVVITVTECDNTPAVVITVTECDNNPAEVAAGGNDATGVALVQEGHYLARAEVFARAYLRGEVARAPASRFRGLLLLYGFDAAAAHAVRERLGAAHVFAPSEVEWRLMQAQRLVEDGVVIYVDGSSSSQVRVQG